MAQHTVLIDVPPVEVLNRDLVVTARGDDNTVGRLTISRGGVGWYSYKDQLERHFTWEQFDRLVKREFKED